MKLTTSLILFLAALAPLTAGAIEEPVFESLATADGVEYRRYSPYLVAETLFSGDKNRNEAANAGFRRLFKYIRGGNQDSEKIAMTAPVRQTQLSDSDKGVKISMTAPVRQSKTDNGWSVAFVLPEQFNTGNVPQPTDPQVAIREIPEVLVAALRYTGRWTQNNVDVHTAELLETLEKAGIEPTAEPVAAYYNSPFSLPFLRRNEILVVVDQVPGTSAAGNDGEGDR